MAALENRLEAHLTDPSFRDWLDAHHHREEQRLDVLENMVAGLRANPIKRQPICTNGAIDLNGRVCIDGEWQPQKGWTVTPAPGVERPDDLMLVGYGCWWIAPSTYKCRSAN